MATIFRPPLIIRLWPQDRGHEQARQTQPPGTPFALGYTLRPLVPPFPTIRDEYRSPASDSRAAVNAQQWVAAPPLTLGETPRPFLTAPLDYRPARDVRGAALHSQVDVVASRALVEVQPAPFVPQETGHPVTRRIVPQPDDATNLLPIGVAVAALLGAQRAIDERRRAPDGRAAREAQPQGRPDQLYAVPFSAAALFVPDWRADRRAIRVDLPQNSLPLGAGSGEASAPFVASSTDRPVSRRDDRGVAIRAQADVGGVRWPLRGELSLPQPRGDVPLATPRGAVATATARGAVATATARDPVATAAGRSGNGAVTSGGGSTGLAAAR